MPLPFLLRGRRHYSGSCDRCAGARFQELEKESRIKADERHPTKTYMVAGASAGGACPPILQGGSMKHKELIDQLTLEEKAALLGGKGEWDSRDIPRLNIPSMIMSDGPHGLRRQAGAGDHLLEYADVQRPS